MIAGSARPLPLSIQRATTLELEVLVEEIEIDPTGVETSRAPVDLTGATICWLLSDACSGVVLVTKLIGSGISVLDQTDPDTLGRFIISIDETDTDRATGVYSHEAVVTLADGRVGAVIPESQFIILPSNKGGAAIPPPAPPPVVPAASADSMFAAIPATEFVSVTAAGTFVPLITLALLEQRPAAAWSIGGGGEILPSSAGIYMVDAQTSFRVQSAGAHQLSVFVDGVEVPGARHENLTQTFDDPNHLSVSTLAQIDAGQTISVRMTNPTGTGDIIVDRGSIRLVRLSD